MILIVIEVAECNWFGIISNGEFSY